MPRIHNVICSRTLADTAAFRRGRDARRAFQNVCRNKVVWCALVLASFFLHWPDHLVVNTTINTFVVKALTMLFITCEETPLCGQIYLVSWHSIPPKPTNAG